MNQAVATQIEPWNPAHRPVSDESLHYPPTLEIGSRPGEWMRFSANRALVRTDFGRVVQVPLRNIGHIERSASQEVGIRWGISTADDSRRAAIRVTEHAAADHLDELGTHLTQSLPGLLFSIRDEAGVHYSRPWSLHELNGFGPPVQRVRGRKLDREGSVIEVQADSRRWRIDDQVGLVASPGSTERPALQLVDDQVVCSDGVVLGTVTPAEHGGIALRLGTGEVLEADRAAGTLRRGRQHIGTISQHSIRLEQPLPEALVISVFLALLDRGHRQDTGDRDREIDLDWVVGLTAFGLFNFPPHPLTMATALILVAWLAFRWIRLYISRD